MGRRRLSLVSVLMSAVEGQFSRIFHRQLTRTQVFAALCALLALPPTVRLLRRMAHDAAAETTTGPPASPSGGGRKQAAAAPARGTYDPEATDPPLLQKHSEIRSYTTSRFTYPRIRVFYRPHPQANQLPTSPAPLPLLVFIHGLGGSVAQFHPLLTSLTNVSSCLAIDLPGCGVSGFAPTSWEAYTTEALVELLEIVISDYRDAESGQGVVLLGHSMGSSLALCLASKATHHSSGLADSVAGLVAICPISKPPSERQAALFRKLLWIPGPIFDLWRAWDRRGGAESPSVRRFVGADADAEAKRLQDMYNNQSKTPVWRRMAYGCLPTYEDGVPKNGLPGEDTWSTLEVPVFLIGGANDEVTPPGEIEKIARRLKPGRPAPDSVSPEPRAIPDSAAPVQSSFQPGEHRTKESISEIKDEDFLGDRRLNAPEETYEDPITPSEAPAGIPIPPLPRHPRMVVKSIVLPSPATHALLYTPSTARILACLVSDFLATHISGRLSLSWQLQYFSREGKWDVKNLAKWKKVVPVGDPIAGVFRAMKTLRELDETHTPSVFAQQWGGVVKDIIDISHDTPVYDPRSLEKAGVRYHKLPTVSKIPPTDVEVESFISLVDRVRADQERRAREEGWRDDHVVGVHCHYGFNRTGYFIVCYIIERCGYTVEDAIDAFAKARPNGIRHSHFLDRLFVRYSSVVGAGRPR